MKNNRSTFIISKPQLGLSYTLLNTEHHVVCANYVTDDIGDPKFIKVTLSNTKPKHSRKGWIKLDLSKLSQPTLGAHGVMSLRDTVEKLDFVEAAGIPKYVDLGYLGVCSHAANILRKRTNKLAYVQFTPLKHIRHLRKPKFMNRQKAREIFKEILKRDKILFERLAKTDTHD